MVKTIAANTFRIFVSWRRQFISSSPRRNLIFVNRLTYDTCPRTPAGSEATGRWVNSFSECRVIEVAGVRQYSGHTVTAVGQSLPNWAARHAPEVVMRMLLVELDSL